MKGVVDAENVIIESDEGNNEARGTALVAASRTFLSFIVRGKEQGASR
jgi:subtilase family serine protease